MLALLNCNPSYFIPKVDLIEGYNIDIHASIRIGYGGKFHFSAHNLLVNLMQILFKGVSIIWSQDNNFVKQLDI